MTRENECQICKDYFEDSDTYEYRGFTFCAEHFDEGQDQVNYKREQVMKVTNASVKSQRQGEFINNRNKYHLGNVSKEDGLPIMKVKEPQILQDYEKGIL